MTRTHYCGAYWRWGFHEDGVVSAHRRGGAHARAGARVNALYEGWVRHRRLQPVEHSFRYRVFMAYLDLDELPESARPRLAVVARAPALVRFRRADYLGDPDIPLADAVRALVAERTGTRPGGPVRLLTNLRYLGHLLQPGQLLLLLRPRRRAGGGGRRRGDEHALGRAPRLRPRRARRRTAPSTSASTRSSTSRPSWPWTTSTSCASPQPGAALSVEIVSRKDGEVHFDATPRARPRRRSTRRACGRVLRRYPAPTLAVVSRIYANAVRLKLKGAPYFGHRERLPDEAPPRGRAPIVHRLLRLVRGGRARAARARPAAGALRRARPGRAAGRGPRGPLPRLLPRAAARQRRPRRGATWTACGRPTTSSRSCASPRATARRSTARAAGVRPLHRPGPRAGARAQHRPPQPPADRRPLRPRQRPLRRSSSTSG